MENFYHLDFETYSPSPLKKVGAYKYAEHPETEILIFAISRERKGGTKVVHTWDCVNGGAKALELFQEAIANRCLIYAHNAPFEAAICKYVLERQLGIKPPALEQWRCTAAMARRAAIPSSLKDCGKFLQLDIKDAKDESGKNLIQYFSVPKKATKTDPRQRILPTDDLERFDQFVEYCAQDVVAEMGVHKRLAAFELKGEVLNSFQFDFRMNDYGVPVNIAGLTRANLLISEYEKTLGAKFFALTGLKHTQTVKNLQWFKARGYPFDNLQKANTEQVIELGPDGWETRYVSNKDVDEATGNLVGDEAAIEIVREETRKTLKPRLQLVDMTGEAWVALETRAMVSFAAVKKVGTMLAAACNDGRVRGSLMWSGAERTHRWAGRIIQPQNFARPMFKDTKLAYEMLCGGADIETLELMFGSFFKVVASCIRHFIQRPAGMLLQADYSSVEGRGAPWLCDGEDKLQRFRDKVPVYETMASKIFDCTVDEVVAAHKAGNSEMRFIGKQAELGCNYQMGWPKFRGTCENYKYVPSNKMVEDYKPTYARRLKRAKVAIVEGMKHNQNGFEVYATKTRYVAEMPKRKAKTILYIVDAEKAGEDFTTYKIRVEAGRKGGTKRFIANPEQPTPEEWVDLAYDDLARRAVYSWREDNPEVVKAWRVLDVCAKEALRNPGKLIEATSKISFAVTRKPGFQALILKLPSGHNLIYPRARLVWKKQKDENGELLKEQKPVDMSDNYNTEIHFWGKVPGSSVWGWCSTYGGKLLENATQGICGDLMGHGACVAEKAGVQAIMLVHDEMIALQQPGQTHETLCEHLCTLPGWAKGFPLEAEGETIPFYKK